MAEEPEEDEDVVLSEENQEALKDVVSSAEVAIVSTASVAPWLKLASIEDMNKIQNELDEKKKEIVVAPEIKK